MPERATKRVAAGNPMETFRKAFPKARETSATVTQVGRFVVSLAAACLLAVGGLAASLLAAAKKVTLNSGVAWTVTDAAGTKAELEPGIRVLKPKLALAGEPALQPPYTFTSKQPLVVADRPYRGKLVVSSDGKLVQIVD